MIWIIVFVVVIAACIPLSQYNAKKREGHFQEQRSQISADKVQDEWSAMIEGAKGHGDELLERVAHRVEQEDIPHAKLLRRSLSIEGSEPHPFLVVANEKFKGFEALVGAYDYGSRLNVVWYFIYDSPEHIESREAAAKGRVASDNWNEKARIHARSGGYTPIEQLSILDKKELKNFATIVHESLKLEVKGTMDGLHLDYSKLDTSTKGFISLS